MCGDFREELKKLIETCSSISAGSNSNYNDNDSSDTTRIYAPAVRQISLLDKFSLESKDVFYKSLDKSISNDDDTLFVVPIKFASFIQQDQNDIAKYIIANHRNVVKVIIGTNAIESSITINELAAVVDTGLFNQTL